MVVVLVRVRGERDFLARQRKTTFGKSPSLLMVDAAAIAFNVVVVPKAVVGICTCCVCKHITPHFHHRCCLCCCCCCCPPNLSLCSRCRIFFFSISAHSRVRVAAMSRLRRPLSLSLSLSLSHSLSLSLIFTSQMAISHQLVLSLPLSLSLLLYRVPFLTRSFDGRISRDVLSKVC